MFSIENSSLPDAGFLLGCCFLCYFGVENYFHCCVKCAIPMLLPRDKVNKYKTYLVVAAYLRGAVRALHWFLSACASKKYLLVL